MKMNARTIKTNSGKNEFTIHGAPHKCVVFQNGVHGSTLWAHKTFRSLVSARRAIRSYIARHNIA
jgi:hypothetical protein